MNIKRHLQFLTRLVPRSGIIAGLILLTIVITYTLLTLLSVPHAPKLKSGSGDSLFVAGNTIYSSAIGTRDGEAKVSFSVGDSVASFVLAGIDKVTPKKESSNSVLFPSVQKDTDLRYTTTPNGLKEEIIINQPSTINDPRSNVYLFDLLLNNVTPKKLTNNFIDPSFKDERGNYLFHFDKPFAVDANGNRTNNVLLQIGYDQSQNLPSTIHDPQPNYYLKLIVDQAWLSDPARVYPITIDPTILHDTTAEFVAGTLNRLKDTGPGATSTLESYYQELPTDQYTVGLWHMNESADNSCSGGQDACDVSGNGNHGTFVGNAAFTTTAKLGAKATTFDGSGDYITFPSGAGIDSSGTIELWFKATTIGAKDYIWADTQDGSNELRIYLDGTNLQFLGYDNAAYQFQLSTPFNDTSTWHHLAATWQSNDARLYIDGVEKANDTSVNMSTYTHTYVALGYRTDGLDGAADYFHGQIDDVRISKIARTPEEIKSSASRRPYSIYTSDVLDLGGAGNWVTTWNPLQWSEHGVNTGDGETLKSSTNLVAQWNFNETSGTTADNAEGTAALDGTLTGFASTASQDQAAGTGWTSANRRWGAGALMFDGGSDYVDAGTNASLNITGNMTISAWIKTTRNSEVIVAKEDYVSGSDNGGYILDIDETGHPRISFRNNAVTNTAASITVNDGMWHYVAGVYNGTQQSIYIDGTLNKTENTVSSIKTVSRPLNIGRAERFGWYFNGVIDSTRIYSRALGAAEIMSNYQAANIEFQTRVGADTSPDDGSWEAWKPMTSETAIDSYDGPYQYNTTDSGLVSYWPMDETADNSCSGGEDACDRKTTNHGTATGTKIVDGKFGKVRSFAGTSDYVSVPDSTSWAFGTGDFTINTWVNFASISSHNGILGQRQDATNFMSLYWDASNKLYFHAIDGGTWRADYNFTWTPTINTWYHLAVVRSGSTFNMYLNGVPQTLTTTTAIGSNSIGNITGVLGIGLSSTFYMNGIMDETQIWNSALSATTIKQKYLEGSTRSGTLHPMTDSTYKLEGSASQKIETGRPTIDGSTIALWHMDETGGTGAYIKDSTTNANHGTPTGTTTINGISGKGRSFNGTSDYIQAPLVTTQTDNWTIMAWAKSNSTSGPGGVVQVGGPGCTGYSITSSGGSWTALYPCVAWNPSIAPVVVGEWIHLAVVRENGVMRAYANGVMTVSGVTSVPISPSGNYTEIGATERSSAYYFNGLIDEVKVSNIARSTEEIAEAYRAGRDHYINKTISSTDLSAKTSLPFYVASDRPGSYLSATIGESAFANYQPDANTVGLWHLAEQSGSGAYIKDSSGTNNHGTPTGTTFAQGKIGKARSFNGSSDYITLPNSIIPAGSGSFEAWFTSNDNTGGRYLWVYQTAGSAPEIRIMTDGSNGLNFYGYDSGTYQWQLNSGAISNFTTQYHHVVGTWKSNEARLYIDGVKVAEDLTVGIISTNTTENRLGYYSATGSKWYGSLDEVRISNTARTADEIRQAYEVGLRTHPITIDFGAKLDSGNLITGSGDLGFTVDATYYGLQNKGDMLFKGDKVIVRENYDGTEYIAQGTVDAITASTGATTVSAWDSGSTFPSGGYTVNASVFKWQREYWNPSASLGTHRNAITNLTMRITDGSEGRTIWLDDLRSNGDYLTAGSGSTIPSSTGSRYMQYRSILSSFDEAVSATLSAVTVDYVINTTPATPSLDAPTDTATNQILSTVLKTTSTDADSDYLRYKIELCTNLAMTTGCQTFDQTSSQTGWSGQNAQTSTAYTSGTQATYTLQTPLSAASTYYWRSYVKDPGGTDTWSGTQTPYSFTTTTAPTAPTVPYAEGASNPTGIIDLTPEFSGVHNDPNSDAANFYEIEVNTDNTFTGTVMWDSNQTAMTSTADGVRSPDLSYAGTALSYNGATYYWRLRFTDVGGAVGAWSATQNFSTNIKPGVPSLDSPSDTGLNQSLSPALKTTATDTNSDYLRYKIQLCTDLAMTLNCQTFDQTVSQTGWSGQNAQTSTAYTSGTQGTYTLTANLSPSTTYYWRSYAIDPGGTDTWSTTQTPYSFTTMNNLQEPGECRLDESNDKTSFTLRWYDRALDEDGYEIQRSVNGGAYSVLATAVAADSISYTDSTIGYGNSYSYKIGAYNNPAPDIYTQWCTASTLLPNTGIFRIN